MNYARALASATRQLTANGQPVTLTYAADGAYDPATTTMTVTDSTVVTVGAVFPLSMGVRGFKYGISDQPGTTVLSSDQQLILPGDIALPPVGTKASIGGVDYTIVAISPINPGGTCIIYDCVIRGAA